MIQEMKLSDLDEIERLEKDLFKNDAWPRSSYEYELKENELSRMYVIKENDEIVAYGGLWFLFENADITTIGTNRKYWHQGYGQRMLEHLLNVAKENNCEFVHLEVRVSNTNAINLYKKNGFEIIRTRKGYYSDNNEDAYDMMRGLL